MKALNKKHLLEPLRASFASSWWIFLKECSLFAGSNLGPLSIGIITFICGMVSVIPYKAEATDADVLRILFHMFYIITLVSGLILSMSAFVSERRQGTMELLYSLPVSDTQLVLGKFLMGMLFMACIALSMSLVYILWLADAPWYIALTGGLGLFLSGLYAYSVGIFASSLTNSYLLSLLIGSLIIGIIDIGGYLSGLLPSPAKEVLTHLHGLSQFFGFTQGVLPLRSLVFFISQIVLFLFLSVKVLESRRWRGFHN